MSRKLQLILGLLAVTFLTSDLHAQVIGDRVGAGQLIAQRITVPANSLAAVTTTGCMATDLDTMLYVLEPVSGVKYRTFAVSDDSIEPDTGVFSFCSLVNIDNRTSSAKTYLVLATAYNNGGSATPGAMYFRIINYNTNADTINKVYTGTFRAAKDTNQTWGTSACQDIFQTKPESIARAPNAIDDTMLAAVNLRIGGESYFSDDEGIGLHAFLKTSSTCSDPQACHILAGGYQFAANPAPITIWHNKISNSICDADGDGVANEIEAFYGTNQGVRDTDGDAFPDYIELIGYTEGSQFARVFDRSVVDVVVDFFADTDYPRELSVKLDAPGIDDSELMPLIGADPLRKDIFYEIDAMPAGPADPFDYSPPAAFESELQALFADTSFTGRDAINFHMAKFGSDRRDSQLLATFKPKIAIAGCCCPTAIEASLARLPTLKNDRSHFVPIRNNIFHYVVVGQQQLKANCGSTGSSGYAEIQGNDIIITDGSRENAGDVNRRQRRTHIHELGHNLSLTHRGNDGSDPLAFSVVYSSVMSYRYQRPGWTASESDELPNFRNSGYSNATCSARPRLCDSNHCVASGQYSSKCGAFINVKPSWAAGVAVSTSCSDCDFNDWQNADVRFQVWNSNGRSGAGSGDAEVLNFEAGVTSAVPDGYTDGLTDLKKLLDSRGIGQGTDYSIGPTGAYLSLDSEKSVPPVTVDPYPRNGEGPVFPVLRCVSFVGGTSYQATFDVVNEYSGIVTIPIGAYNALSPGNQGQGQPTSFGHGQSPQVVSVPFQAGATVTWTLGAASATATASSPACIY